MVKLKKLIAKLKRRIYTGFKNYATICTLTRRCNLNCKYCNVIRNNNDIELSVDEWKKIVDNFVENGFNDFIFQGGEPLLYENLGELIDYVSKRAYVSIVTNGQLLDEEKLKELKNLDHLAISVDNISKLVTEKTILNQFEMIKNYSEKYNIPVEILSIITPKNMKEILQIIKICESLGFHHRAQIVHISNRRSDNYKYQFRAFAPILKFKTEKEFKKLREFQRILFELKKKGYRLQNPYGYILHTDKYVTNHTQNYCYAGEKYFAVNNDGRIMPCIDMPPSSFNALNLSRENFNKMKEEVKKMRDKNCRCFYICYYTTRNFIEWLQEGVYDIFFRKNFLSNMMIKFLC